MDKKHKSALLDAKEYLQEAELLFVNQESHQQLKTKILSGALEQVLKKLPAKVGSHGMDAQPRLLLVCVTVVWTKNDVSILFE